MPGLGVEFRVARDARSLSLSDVSEQIHIRTVYLQAIEDEDWAAIAAPVYVRGFIRTYARFLGLDGEHAVAHFNESLGAKPKADEPQVIVTSSGGAKQRPRVSSTTGKPSPWLWAALAAAAALVLFVGYSYVQFQQNGAQVASDAAETPVPIPGATADTRPRAAGKGKHGRVAGKHTLQVRFTQASWLLVKIDGTQALEGIFPPGTVKEFNGGKKAIIRAGNAGGVDLTVNGRALGSMGKSGAVVDRTIGLTAE